MLTINNTLIHTHTYSKARCRNLYESSVTNGTNQNKHSPFPANYYTHAHRSALLQAHARHDRSVRPLPVHIHDSSLFMRTSLAINGETGFAPLTGTRSRVRCTLGTYAQSQSSTVRRRRRDTPHIPIRARVPCVPLNVVAFSCSTQAVHNGRTTSTATHSRRVVRVVLFHFAVARSLSVRLTIVNREPVFIKRACTNTHKHSHTSEMSCARMPGPTVQRTDLGTDSVA